MTPFNGRGLNQSLCFSAAGTFEQKKGEEDLLRAARDGEVSRLTDMVGVKYHFNMICSVHNS